MENSNNIRPNMNQSFRIRENLKHQIIKIVDGHSYENVGIVLKKLLNELKSKAIIQGR